MKLAGLFTGDNQIADTGKTQANTVRSDTVNRQIQAMIPGQTIQGELVSRNGNEVQIRVADDMVLTAKLEQNLNLEVGANMTFEVKNNGKALVLSPLFTNVATDANVLKALEMASLPVNGTTISLTQSLMEARLPIDRHTLQQVYREVNMFPEATTSDIVYLHKMQMPVNETNVAQMVSYRNLTHQLVTGLNNVLDAVPEMFSQMIESGDTERAVWLYRQFLSLVQESSADDTVSGEGMTGNGPMTKQDDMTGNVNMTENINLTDKVNTTENVNWTENVNISETVHITENAEISEKIELAGSTDIRETVPATEETAVHEPAGMVGSTAASDASDTGFQSISAQMSRLWQKNGGKDILEPVLRLLKEQWTITPEEVADSEKVESLYHRLNKQLRSLTQTLEDSGQTASTAYKAVTNLTQNLDFLQQVNQLYTYVQLPLRLQRGEAHGDLYVYTNKKHLASKDGQISALLHLDMEHLGPVDVYVSMLHEKVNTKFYLQDDDMLDFMMEHMDILTERLQKRGYQCTYEMQLRLQEEKMSKGILTLLQQESQVPLAEYAFDVRT